MENASKALLMAGGLLIVMIIIAVGIYTYSGYTGIGKQVDENKKVEQIKEFNTQYEIYDQKFLRGIELITLINKAIDYNNKTDSPNDRIEVSFKTTIAKNVTSYDNLENGTSYTFTNNVPVNYKDWSNSEITVSGKKEKCIDNFKIKRYFKCDKIQYKGIDGKVSKLEFTEITAEVNAKPFEYQTVR